MHHNPDDFKCIQLKISPILPPLVPYLAPAFSQAFISHPQDRLPLISGPLLSLFFCSFLSLFTDRQTAQLELQRPTEPGSHPRLPSSPLCLGESFPPSEP